MKENAIKFFENEIYHYNIMLNGIMRPEYREYILAKKSYYEMAIAAIKEQEQEQKANLENIEIEIFSVESVSQN